MRTYGKIDPDWLAVRIRCPSCQAWVDGRADAVCSELLRQNIDANPADYEDADWDLYYAEFSEFMTSFLPKAHELVLPSP